MSRNFERLLEVLKIEQFINCLPYQIKQWFLIKKPANLTEAARWADEYAVFHNSDNSPRFVTIRVYLLVNFESMREMFLLEMIGDLENEKVVFPRISREKLLFLAHDIPVSGHLDVQMTLDRVQRNIWWRGVSRIVKNYCRTCDYVRGWEREGLSLKHL